MFDESKHKRDGDGKFAKQGGREYSDDVNGRIAWTKDNNIDVPLNYDGSVDDIALQKLRNDNNATDYGSQEELDKLLGEEFKGYKGQAAVDKLLKEQRGHVKGAFHRDDIGDIDLLWGNDYIGLKHIIKQREKQGIDVHSFLSGLGDIVTKGLFRKKNDRGNFEFLLNGKMVIISPEYHGNKITYVLTAYKTSIKK